jgi:hypothetical protein
VLSGSKSRQSAAEMALETLEWMLASACETASQCIREMDEAELEALAERIQERRRMCLHLSHHWALGSMKQIVDHRIRHNAEAGWMEER